LRRVLTLRWGGWNGKERRGGEGRGGGDGEEGRTRDIIIVSFHHALPRQSAKDNATKLRNTFETPVYHALIAVIVLHLWAVIFSARPMTSEGSVEAMVSWSEKLYPECRLTQVMFVVLELSTGGLLDEGM